MDVSTALQVFVSPLLGTIFDNLSSLIGSKFGLINGVDEELESLSNTLSTIQDVLEDAELKQVTTKPIRNWLKRFKDVAYEADDLLDECRTYEAVSKVESEIVETNESFNNILALTDYVPSFFSAETISSRHALGQGIKKLRQKFDEIAEQRSKFDLNSNVIVKDVQSEVKLLRETSSFLVDPQVYGRDEDKEYIVNLLLNKTGAHPNDGPQEEDVRVCAILGMGGLGKTTLAQMVHNDEKIKNHFELRCWVCVSENFETKTVLKAIIESSGGSAHDLQYLNSLQHRIREIFRDKRFLVVLDDVWNDDEATWEILISLLRCGGKGSSIIVTTRLEGVASLTTNLPICRPKLLSEEHCWSLFKHRVFNKKENHPNLEEIGREIVKKCRGIPLAAKALGGLLRTKRKEKEWLYVKNSDIWNLPQDKSYAILPALMMSYNHLPIHLRQCFAFCSIFPKDFEIEREKLIHLWIANGFVQSKGGNLELEDVGDEIFNDLSYRSFFQDFKKDEDGIVSSCKMHDLVHDLACSISKDESSSTRHLSSSSSPEVSFPENSAHLRTFMQLPSSPWPAAFRLQFIFWNAKCLRALDLSRSGLSALPDSIGNLKHLRYLNLSHAHIKSLPNESFCTLINLQTLKLYLCEQLEALPKDIWKMSSLRHLDIKGCYSLTGMPIGMGKLTCLQTLEWYIVGAERGCGMITELQRLDHLKGSLVITGLKNVRNSTDARNANLVKKPYLQGLSLAWSPSQQNDSGTTEEKEKELGSMVGEGLQPHPNIKALCISWFSGAKLPRWMGDISCLPNLVELLLDNCNGCEHLPSLGQLPLLKVLDIYKMDSLAHIGNEFYHRNDHHHPQATFFPSLEKLKITAMPNLEEFSSPSLLSCSPPSSGPSDQLIENTRGVEAQVLAFPYLKRLEIDNCPTLRRLIPFPSSLEELHLNRCNEMILSRSLENLPPHITILDIGDFDEMVSFPVVEPMMWMRLRSLIELTIRWCPKLKTLPKEFMENLTALTHLAIVGCHGFIYLPEGMQNLKSFRILKCFGLRSLQRGLRHLMNLKELIIDDCPGLEFLPEDVDYSQHLVALEYLKLKRLPKMTSLPGWISNLTLLHHLKIEYCTNLKFLPNEGLQQLTALQILRIVECHPDLRTRLQKDGDDWHKIAHVPILTIS